MLQQPGSHILRCRCHKMEEAWKLNTLAIGQPLWWLVTQGSDSRKAQAPEVPLQEHPSVPGQA